MLARELGAGYKVIEEGLNGRTTVWDDPIEEGRNGKTYLAPCLETHRPIDLVVLMLGTNDLQQRLSVPAFDIGRSIGALLQIIGRSAAGRAGQAPRVLLIAPPALARLTAFAEMFAGGTEKSRLLGCYYKEQATLAGCEFLDAAGIIRSSDIDGIHLEPAEHQTLGRAVAERVRAAV